MRSRCPWRDKSKQSPHEARPWTPSTSTPNQTATALSWSCCGRCHLPPPCHHLRHAGRGHLYTWSILVVGLARRKAGLEPTSALLEVHCGNCTCKRAAAVVLGVRTRGQPALDGSAKHGRGVGLACAAVTMGMSRGLSWHSLQTVQVAVQVAV